MYLKRVSHVQNPRRHATFVVRTPLCGAMEAGMEQAVADDAAKPAGTRGNIMAGDAAAHSAEGRALGRLAARPHQIPWAGWKRVLRRTATEVITDRISLVAAGCAFYATLALFPAISMIISIYGLVFDPATVEPQLAQLRDLLPPSAFSLISDRVHVLVSKPQGDLTFSLVISICIALWSSATGTKSILGALNLAYEEREQRGFLRFQLTALGLTLGGMVAAAVGIGALVLLPAVETFLGISAWAKLLARVASLGVLVVFVMFALSLLYRFGPSRKSPSWHWVTPGSSLATLLWLVASVLFSYYVGHLASYDATYGPLGAVVGVMMWFWVTAFVVLAGAELNAELELQTAQDSTGAEKPIGTRGAYVADHVAT